MEAHSRRFRYRVNELTRGLARNKFGVAMTRVHRSPSLLLFLAALFSLGAAALRPRATASPLPGPLPQAEPAKQPVPATAVIEPEELAHILGSREAEKPLVLQVGFRFLYREAHIPGAEYAGPASKEEGLKLLRERLAGIAHGKFIVLYCGCCPWIKCPNVKPAYDLLRSMGFTHVRVLRIDENFGANWVSKGYPAAKGE